MFQRKSSIGQHTVYSYDTTQYKLQELIEEIYGIDIQSLQNSSKDFQTREAGTLRDIETDIHKKFYTFIKSNDRFKTVYCQIIRDLVDQFFPDEPAMLYQSFPSIRFQFVGNTCVPPHCDSDDTGRHPVGERNFLIPITKMIGTTRLFIETEPKKGDHTGIDMEYGDILSFNGNTCVHYNTVNVEQYMRISFDFRMITLKDYMNYTMYNEITKTNPRDIESRKPVNMIVGGYYQCLFRQSDLVKMMKWHTSSSIVQSRPCFNEEEPNACVSYFQTGDPFLTEFKQTESLENAIRTLTGSTHCFMTPSGTSALITALLACNVGPGDEVLVPDYTMVATANSIRLLGAKPIFVDVHPNSYTLHVDDVIKHLTPSTKAVIHVTLNNRSIGLTELASLCKQKNLYLIEDAAQSLGCLIDGKHYGTIGDIGCFSFSTPKIITTGQGGCLITNNTTLATKILTLKNFGRKMGGVEVYDSFGVNFKFTDLQAVVGLAQMKKLPQRVRRMREMFDMYYQGLSACRAVVIRPAPNDEWIPWFIEVETERRDDLAAFLSKHSVQTRITYPSIHSLPVYGEPGSFPNSDHISKHGLFLPTHFLLTNEQILYICDLINIYDLHCIQKEV